MEKEHRVYRILAGMACLSCHSACSIHTVIGSLKRLRINEPEQGITFAQFVGAGLGAKVAVGAVVALAFKAGAEIEGADIVATVAIGTGLFGIGENHGACTVGLQQHLDQRIRTAPLAEFFLVVHEKAHEAQQ